MSAVRTLTVYSNKFTLVRIDKLVIAYHLNIPIQLGCLSQLKEVLRSLSNQHCL
jgi:hypothetical protein